MSGWKESAGGILMPAGDDDPEVLLEAGDEPIPGICISCGCTDEFGCENGCWWADDSETICSNCV